MGLGRFFYGAGSGSGAGGGDAGAPSLIFADFGTQDESVGRYTSWADLMAKFATFQIGGAPLLTFALQTGPFSIPSLGMPVTGWDFRGGKFASYYRATGSVVVDCPAGVKLDNLFGLDQGLVLTCAPAAGEGVLEFTALPPGAGRIFQIGDGCYIDNQGAGAFWRSKGDFAGGTTHVLVCFSSGFAVAAPPPPAGAKLLFLSNDGGEEDDSCVLVQGQTTLGGLPADSVANNNANANVIRIYDASAHPDTADLATWQPNLTATPVFSFTAHQSKVLAYDDALAAPPTVPLGAADVQAALDKLKDPANVIPSSTAYPPGTWATSDPASLSEANQRMAVALAGLLGGPIP